MDPRTRFGGNDVLTRRDLLARGCSVTELAAAVRRGTLIRVRLGYYARPGLDPQTERAVRVGGRLTCVSELRHRGIWVPPAGPPHVQIAPNAARLRDPDDRLRRLSIPRNCVLHWMPLLDPDRADRGHVSVVDALAMAARCLPPRLALASLDSATHLELVTPSELEQIASSLPLGRRRLLLRIDGHSESGLETIVRDVLIELGFRVVLQQKFQGIGRPDLVVEEWVIVEADGDAYHDAKITSRDRRRDASFAATQRTVLHFRYSQIMYELESVVEAVIAAVEVHRNIRNSGRIAARARRRLTKLDLS